MTAVYANSIAVLWIYRQGLFLIILRKNWLKEGLKTLTTIADGVSRRDRRERDMKLRDAAGKVAGVRSLLSVAWAQDAVNDEVFAKLDGAYESLANKLPR